MTLNEIKQAIKEGKTVYWCNNAYKITKFKGNYYIAYQPNNNVIGLTWTDGKTLNGNPQDFYTDRSMTHKCKCTHCG